MLILEGCGKLVDIFILFENGESLDIEDVDMEQIEFVDGKVLHIPSSDGGEAHHVNFDKVLYVNYMESEE